MIHLKGARTIMRMSRVLTAVAATLMLTPLLAAAATPSDLPPVMAKVTQSGVAVTKEFNAIGGLKGWVLDHDHQPAIAYTTPDGKALLFGALINQQGMNMTAAYLKQYSPKVPFSKLIPELQKAHTINIGKPNSAHVIYSFEDPNCIFCHLTDIELAPYIKAGLEVKIVPVAILKKSSAGKAAAIMQAKDPSAAWEANEAHFNESAEEGGAVPIAHPAAGTVKDLTSNLQLMQAFGFNGTPGIVYEQGGKWHTINGMPQEAVLPKITGLPQQKETDPQLARFQQ